MNHKSILFTLLWIFSSNFILNANNNINDPIYNEIRLDSIEKFDKRNLVRLECFLLVELFTKTLVEKGIKLNQTKESDDIKLVVLVSDFNVKYGPEMNNTIAIALGSSIDSIVKIDVNYLIWNKLTEVEKVSTIFHEVSHDILNVKHVESDIFNLMHPSAQPKNYGELEIMTNKFIRDFKMGRVNKFSNGIYIHDRTNKNKPYLKNL